MATSLGVSLCLKPSTRLHTRRVIDQCRRALATEAASIPTSTSPLLASIILNRAPTLTPISSEFEKAYYTYQSNIARSLSHPFPTDFYFKKGSQLQRRFEMEEKERELAAFGESLQEAKRLRAVAAAAKTRVVSKGGKGKKDQQQASTSPTINEEELEELEQLEEEPPADRISEADKSGDVTSLNRKGDRNLYLLVKTVDDSKHWSFPQGSLEGEEPLHQAALRQLHAQCGPNMDTWVVGRHPIGFYDLAQPKPSKVFFFKGHIIKGQATPDPKRVTDFAWLAKEEIESRVDQQYWLGVKDMLSDV